MSETPTRGPLDHPELLGATQPFTITDDGRCEVVDEGPPSREDELESGTALGDWRIHDKIGEGGMGTVYAAVHEVIGKRAAIKVVRRNRCRSLITADRFVQEARVVNEIGHPNIVDIFHVGRLADGRPYLVMELLHGCTLADRLVEPRMGLGEALDVLLGVTAAMEAAHAKGVVHRDLKPGNVFLAEGPGGRPVVKVVDWGIAKPSAELPQAIGLTTTGVMLGTPLYVSPEQARGRNLDARSDIYSLGVIAYEVFTGDPPFVADNVADVLSMHLRARPAPPSDAWPEMPAALEQLILRMLAKDAAARPDLAEVIATLRAVQSGADPRAAGVARRRFAAGSCPPNYAPVEMTDSDAAAIACELDGMITSRHADTAPVVVPLVPDDDDDDGGDSVEIVLAPMAAPARWPWLLAGMALALAGVAALVIARARAAAPDATATLEVRVTPPSARLVIDGAPRAAAHGVAIATVPTGDHAICVDAPGYAPATQAIRLTGPLVVHVVLAPAVTAARCPASAP